MTLFARLFRLIWGGNVDRALRPVLAVSLAGSIAGSTAYPYMGIWAIKHLGAPQISLAFTYLGGAVLAGVTGYIAGHWSDKIGRRPLILMGWGFQALVPLLLLAVGDRLVPGLILLMLLPAFGSLGGAADQAMVADLVAPERRVDAYASVRIASNFGVVLGPPIGGLLLIGGEWSHLWAGTLVLASIGFFIAYRYIPRTGLYAPEGPPERGSLRVILADSPFLLFMVSSIFATMTYVATETLLPISVTTSHNLSPAVWGFLWIVNPLFVTLFQLRLIRRTENISAALKLGVAMPLMGVPFLLLGWNGSVGVILLVIVLFVIGEMLWVPTSQAAVASFAPADIRGAYMGAFGGTWAVGWAATPFLGLVVRNGYGDETMWSFIAVIGIIAGILGFAAVRGRAVPSGSP
jgi:predicted MFS family arabinose efflux permease